ncbi:nonribosomal peptide synthetase [Peribacillus alkalitolerans]|uniref:SF0329 family protein n=1 Tax=Peribacillus alkalitolerans TaxID=1550385 RepID=UPI0013D1EB7C|nr:nonribosomal peptide synthetase [Peribacillus alkalitolerans]
MQWSKSKSILESFLCEKLKGRVQIYTTVYRKYHDGPSRVWITFDKKQIVSASDVTYMMKHNKLYEEIKKERELKKIPYSPDFDVMYNSKERHELVKASDDAEQILINAEIFESYHLLRPIMDYPSLSIEEAMDSENIFIQAFSMFDRRLGKRRLEKKIFLESTHSLVIKFFKIRCEVEGIDSKGSI